MPDDAAFQRAFAAVSYFAGAREPARLVPFEPLHPSAAALCAELAAPDGARRAAALARELAAIARSLEARRLA